MRALLLGLALLLTTDAGAACKRAVLPASLPASGPSRIVLSVCDMQSDCEALKGREGDICFPSETATHLVYHDGAWASMATGGGGGAPTNAAYWTSAPSSGLSAEVDLGALATGLLVNTSGVPSRYTGASCSSQFVRALDPSGGPTCSSVADADVSGGAAIAESKLDLAFPTHSSANDPAAGEKAALAGTSGTPGSGNRYVTNADSRLTDARTPTTHAHAEADVTGLVSDLAGKAATSHTHAAADVTSGALAGARGGLGAAQPTCTGGDFLTCNGSTCSCATPAGGGGPTVARVTADVANNSATVWADVTGLTRAVAASTTYTYECRLTYITAATTTALHLSTNGPASPTAHRYAVVVGTTATAKHEASQTAYNTVTNPATGGGATSLTAVIAGTFENGANAGTLAIRFKSEVASSAVTVQRGSACRFY